MGVPAWHGDTNQDDWLLDGEPIRRKEQLEKWRRLDWTRAYVDMGPSPAGNVGPYWHVPWELDDDELWARLYPKVLLTKWLPIIRQAVAEKAAPKPHTDNQGAGGKG